jgi:SAM-dependent methyltransferase
MQPRTPDRDTAALLDAYNEVAYVSDPVPQCHPNRLATVGRLLGLETAPLATCRVLELACGEGINLLPPAASLPRAVFVGVDIAPAPLARAQQMADDLGLANVRLLQCDLAALPSDLGQFDYVIARGVHSWLPDEVRARLLPAIACHLAPGGVAFASYNTLPGCHLRRAVWDLLRQHTHAIGERRERLAAVRALGALFTTPPDGMPPAQAAFRAEVRHAIEASEAELEHDNLAPVNHPVYFHEFAAEAAQAGLAFLAEADLASMLGWGLPPDVRRALGAMDRLAREQYLDFLGFRRYRESLLCHAQALSRFVVRPERALSLHAVATAQLRLAPRGTEIPAGGEGGALRERLRATFPQSVAVEELVQAQPRAAGERPTVQAVVEAYVARDLELLIEPVAVVAVPGERPEAFAAARWLAREHAVVPSVYQDVVRLGAPLVRRLVAGLDGTRTRDELIAFLDDPALAVDPGPRLEHLLGQLAASALLVR